MGKCNHYWIHPFNVLNGQFVPYAYKCKLCDEIVISDNGPIPEIEQKMKATIMHHHNFTPAVEPQESKIEGIIIATACIAVFALWGVLLALGV